MYRVLMIAPTPFFADRGCHVRILGEIEALQEEGCDVTLCTYHNGRDVPGVETIRIPNVPWYDKLEAGPSNHKYYLDLLLLGQSLRAALGRRRPDVIHGHLHEGAFIGRLVSAAVRRPLLFDYQGSLTGELADHGYAGGGGVAYRILGGLERWIDRGADVVIASTDRASDALRDRLPAGRVKTVMDGVDTGVFRPMDPERQRAIRDRYEVPPDAVVAVFVGVLAPYQGIDLLLENARLALDAAPDLHLLIVGYPEEEYRARAGELGLTDRITFTGKVPFEETPDLTAAADIALTPKISATEGNLKVYNYLACGLPVVAFDNPVNREIMGEIGVYAPAGDGAAFARALGDLAVDPERRRLLSTRGRELAVDQLSWRRAARDIMTAYAEAGARPTGGQAAQSGDTASPAGAA